MTIEARHVLELTADLSAEERAEVAAVVEESQGDGEADRLSPAWRDEIDHRLEALRTGQMQVFSAEDVDRELEEIIERARRRTRG